MTAKFLGAVAALTAAAGHESSIFGPFLTVLPVIEPDIQRRPGHIWPAFSKAIQSENLGAIFASLFRVTHFPQAGPCWK
jgi:hypothetical protein